MEISIDNRQNIVEVDSGLEKTLEQVVMTCLEEEGLGNEVEISISFVTNEEIHKLNQMYRNVDRPTDVLSFPQYEGEVKDIKGFIYLGDIVISLEKAVEQAEEYGHSFEREVAFLTAHSMFHLMGYDHDNEENTKVMRKKEEKVLQTLGIIRI